MLGLGAGINKLSAAEAAAIAGRLPGFTGLLDETFGATAEAAYSVRQLSASQSVAMTIRRDSDNAETDIGFDSNGNLDEAAIETFCTGTVCKVSSWADQSGNGNDATQSTAANQPTIYTGGALVKDNGRAAIDFSAGAFYLDATISNQTQPFSFYNVFQWKTTGIPFCFFATGGSFRRARLFSPRNMITAGTTLTFNQDKWATAQQAQETLIADGANSIARGSGTQIIQGNAGSNSTGTTLKIGAREDNAQDFDGYAQELVYYPANKSTGDRTSIEENQGDYFTQNTPLLDTYSGAAAAYSLRKLRSDYSGNAVKVRRASDNVEADIGFNVFKELDTVALVAHCGSSDGFVSVWYDQSSSNNATQTTAANQPKIYDGTTGVVTENGKPAVEFNGDKLGEFSLALSQPYSFNYVGRYAGNTSSAFAPFFGSRSTTFVSFMVRNNNWMQQSPTLATNSTTVDTNQHNWFLLYDGASSFVGVDGGTAATSNPGASAIENFAIGARGTDSATTELRYFQELILWGSDQSSNRANIEDNINTFYNIY